MWGDEPEGTNRAKGGGGCIPKYWNEEMETLPRERMRELQTERLLKAVRYAYDNVPMYMTRYDEAGTSPDLVELSDIQDLPFTVKNDLRDHYPYGIMARPLGDIVRIHASSGTTGKPTVVTYTRSDLDIWTNMMARNFTAAGVGRDDIVHNAYGYGLFTGGLGFHYGAERVGAKVLPVAAGNTKRQLQMMHDMGSTVLCCTPSYAVYLTEAAQKEGYDPRSDFKLRVGMFGAEPWSEEARRTIQDTFGLQGYDTYGLSEIYGPGVGGECEHQNGLHIWEDEVLIEIIDPETGRWMEPGQLGEIVLTMLRREAMPLIRYRTRDLGWVSVDECECGRTTTRLMEIRGRSDDMLIIGGVNIFPSQVESVLMQVPELGDQYQILVDRSRALTRLGVQVEVTPEFAARADADWDGLAARVTESMKATLAINAKVELMDPESLPRYEGKAKRVIEVGK
jgi:phenylacetate-CoA ligase